MAIGLRSHVSSPPTYRIPPTTLRPGVRPAFRWIGTCRTLIFQGAGMSDQEAYERAVEVGLILGIAEALRHEFGDSIDAHPGGLGNEAGLVNRAFRVAARRILGSIVLGSENLDGAVIWALRRAALLRLSEVGVEADRTMELLDQEPGLGDAWLAYLALAPSCVLEDLIGDGVERHRSDG